MTTSDVAYVEKLESQIRETSIFDQFDFIGEPKVSDDQWGEPDPLANDDWWEELY